MSSGVRVEYGGIMFRGKGYTAVPGDKTFGIARSGLQGFDAPAGRRGEDIARPGDGSFALATHAGAAIRSISGIAVANSHRELMVMRDDFAGLASADLRPMVYWVEGIPRSTDAQVWDQPTWEWDPRDRHAKFQLMLRCPWPFWLGDAHAQELSTGLELVNRGTANAWPVIRITGPVSTAFSITVGGRKVRVDRTLTATQWVEITTRTGVARTNAGELLLSEVTGLMPYLPPGVSTVVLSNITAPRVKFSWSDTYV